MNQTLVNYEKAPKTSPMQDYVFNLTRVISNSTADAVGECYTTAFNYYQYFIMRASQFPDFIGIMTAFLQNMIGNILNFNTLYTNIVNAQKAGKMTDVYFFMGRLTYLIIYFDPIVEAHLKSPAPAFDFAETYGKYYLGQKYAGREGELASMVSIIFDLPSTFLNSSIAISSPNSSICIGNLSLLNQSA